MTLPQKMSKTLATTTKSIELEGNISDQLFEEYRERRKALDVAERLIAEAITKMPDMIGTTIRGPIIIEPGHFGRPTAKIACQVTIDGYYKSEGGAPEFMDPKTLNLLLNSKILTDAEKRQLLKKRGLLPDVEKADSPES